MVPSSVAGDRCPRQKSAAAGRPRAMPFSPLLDPRTLSVARSARTVAAVYGRQSFRAVVVALSLLPWRRGRPVRRFLHETRDRRSSQMV